MSSRQVNQLVAKGDLAAFHDTLTGGMPHLCRQTACSLSPEE